MGLGSNTKPAARRAGGRAARPALALRFWDGSTLPSTGADGDGDDNGDGGPVSRPAPRARGDRQERKLETICRKLALTPGERVLDVGCGWGSFAIHAATRHGADVVGITLSELRAHARALARRLDENATEAERPAGAERLRIWRLYQRAARSGVQTGVTTIYQVRCRRS